MDGFVIPTGASGQASVYEELYREYLEDRVLVFNDEVNDNMVEDIVLYILKWNKEDIGLPIECRKKIRIYMSSVGGDTFVSRNVVDVIMQSKTPIVGIGLSLVASACYAIFLACHERVAFENSVFLQHDGSISITNSSKKAQSTMDFFRAMEKSDKEFVLSRTNMTEDFYDSIYDEEYYMTCAKAVELGVVDKVIGKDIDLDEIL